MRIFSRNLVVIKIYVGLPMIQEIVDDKTVPNCNIEHQCNKHSGRAQIVGSARKLMMLGTHHIKTGHLEFQCAGFIHVT